MARQKAPVAPTIDDEDEVEDAPEPKKRVEPIGRNGLLDKGFKEPKTIELWSTYRDYKIVLRNETKSLREGRDGKMDRITSQQNVTVTFKGHKAKVGPSWAKVILAQQEFQYGSDFIFVDNPKVSKEALEAELGTEIKFWDETAVRGLKHMMRDQKTRRRANAFCFQMHRRDVLQVGSADAVEAADLIHELAGTKPDPEDEDDSEE